METVAKAVGWVLAIATAMFLYAACESGMLDKELDKLKDKVPSVEVNK